MHINIASNNSKCPHFDVLDGELWFHITRFSTTKCNDCDYSGNAKWVCLTPKCCYVGCSSTKNNHADKHYKELSHSVQLNLRSYRGWCHSCQDEVVPGEKDTTFQNLISSAETSDKKKAHIENEKRNGHVLVDEKTETKKSRVDIRGEGEYDSATTAALFTLRSMASAGRPYRERDSSSAVPESWFEVNQRETPGVVGLRNLGNTCYMNSILQVLSNCPPLTEYFLNCRLPIDYSHYCLALGYEKLAKDMWSQVNSPCSVAPVDILHVMRTIHPAFRGFQQQDAQEFLRCLLDAMHEDLKQPVYPWEAQEKDFLSQRDRISSIDLSENEKTCSQRERSDKNLSTSSSSSDQDFYLAKTNDSGWSSDIEMKNQQPEQTLRRRRNVKSECALHLEQEALESADQSIKYRLRNSPTPLAAVAPCNEGSRSASVSNRRHNKRRPAAVRRGHDEISLRKPVRYRSIVSDVFDGRILSSVQCLTCNTVSETLETFQDLSLPIPSKDQVDMLKHSSKRQPAADTQSEPSVGWLGWLYNWFWSWIAGPKVTLEDCLSAFFSADDLKGDDMYRCDRCKKLRNGVKFSSLLSLPEVLCIHLKRFRHETIYSSKITTSIEFPSEGLNMAQFLHKRSRDEVCAYDLTGVVCHRGSVEGGHYIAYCFNAVNGNWYEFDDQFCTQVDIYNVRSSEAYVLFYRKSSERIDRLRQDVCQQLNMSKARSTQYYISRHWIHRFNTFAEPGTITNFDFLCPHGWLSPTKAAFASELYCQLPDHVWHTLYKHFRGGPVCVQLRHCFECQQWRNKIIAKRKFELDEFSRLQKQLTQQPGHLENCTYCVGNKWFTEWEAFVNEKCDDPPGPVTNSDIVRKSRDATTLELNPKSSFVQISQAMWEFFQSRYGGGPPVVVQSIPKLSAFSFKMMRL